MSILTADFKLLTFEDYSMDLCPISQQAVILNWQFTKELIQ